jgi:Ca2+-binding RTX toxin-like protein
MARLRGGSLVPVRMDEFTFKDIITKGRLLAQSPSALKVLVDRKINEVVTFRGHFNYDADGNLAGGGTVTSLTDTVGRNKLAVAVTGLKLRADYLLVLMEKAPAALVKAVLFARKDTLIGTKFDDALFGGAGNDTLVGGAGADALTGGAGADTFVIATPGEADTIADFEAGIDTIELAGAAFGAAAGALDPDAFHAGAAAEDAEDRIVYDQATGQLWFDADGAGAASPVLLAVVANRAALAHTDFLIA